MALSGSFGVAPQRQPAAPVAAGGPQVLLLQVSVQTGGFLREHTLAVGVRRQELETFLGRWLQQADHRQQYLSHKIIAVPFLVPA